MRCFLSGREEMGCDSVGAENGWVLPAIFLEEHFTPLNCPQIGSRSVLVDKSTHRVTLDNRLFSVLFPGPTLIRNCRVSIRVKSSGSQWTTLPPPPPQNPPLPSPSSAPTTPRSATASIPASNSAPTSSSTPTPPPSSTQTSP